MEIYKDFFKRFKIHRITVEFHEDELRGAVFTPEEQAEIGSARQRSGIERLEFAQIVARGIERGGNNQMEKKSWLK